MECNSMNKVVVTYIAHQSDYYVKQCHYCTDMDKIKCHKCMGTGKIKLDIN
jgi:hypothetical protein